MRISFGNYTAEMEAFGAELTSFKKDGVECVWIRNPAVWKGSSPWLFPVVGRLKDDAFTFNGTDYALNAHGFASKRMFTPEKLSENHARFTLKADETTKACYPFSFVLTIDYTLDENGLTMAARVTNEDSTDMLFSLGAHPGFLCETGDALVFNTDQTMDVLRLNADHLLVRTPKEWIRSGRLTLTPSLFDEDAMILPHPAASSVTLVRQSGQNVRVDFGCVSYLGLWSRKGDDLPYVCIEPWFGVDDPAESDQQLAHKEAIQRLAPHDSFTQTVRISAL